MWAASSPTSPTSSCSRVLQRRARGGICASATSATSRPSPATAWSARTSTSRSPRRRAQAGHARRGPHQQGRHLRPDALDRRRDIINDDLGAITTVPTSSAWLGPEDQRRLLDGVHEQRRVLQRRQQELHLRRGHRPRHRWPHQGRGRLHGPRGLRRQAHRRDARDPAGADGALGDGHAALQNVELRDTTANTKFPVANPHQGKFRIEVSRYLSTPSTPATRPRRGTSSPDPSDLPVIEMAFLNGQEARPSRPPTRTSTCSASGCVGTTTSASTCRTRGGVKNKGEV